MDGACIINPREPRQRSFFRISTSLPFFLLLVFFNSVGLPGPLEYATFLSPFFYIWLIKIRCRWVLSKFILVSIPFVIIHIINGVDFYLYVKSYAFYLTIYITAYTTYVVIQKCNNIKNLFIAIIVINFSLVCISMPFLFTEYSSLFWWNVEVGRTLGFVKRLKLLANEASHYSGIISPYFVWSYFYMLLTRNKYRYLFFILTAIPMSLSFSFGILSSLAIALFGINLIYIKNLYKKNKNYVKYVIPIALLIMVAFGAQSNFYSRLNDFVNGRDASGTGRIFASTSIAVEVASQKSLWWGVGPGQTKTYYDVMINFMKLNYQQGWMNEGLYNSIADVFASIGIIGVLLKIFSEWYLFFKTRVYSNYFRLTLFITIFIYQFTGSNIANLSEYIIWVLVFSQIFPEFDIKQDKYLARRNSEMQRPVVII